MEPARFRSAVLAIPAAERDAWVDRALGLQEIPDDGPALPADGVPYLPCPVADLLAVAAHVTPDDVFVDLGAGMGRAAAFVARATGARAIGVEIQPELVRAARGLFPEVHFVEGDAAALAPELGEGTVFFLYCPFSGERLARLLDGLAAIARTRPIRVCCVDLPLPPRDWLRLEASQDGLDVHRSASGHQNEKNRPSDPA